MTRPEGTEEKGEEMAEHDKKNAKHDIQLDCETKPCSNKQLTSQKLANQQ